MTPKPLNKRQRREREVHRRYLKRIYELCASGNWRLRYVPMYNNPRVADHVGSDLAENGFLWKSVGCVDPACRIIYVDYRFDVLSTFIHECLHVLVDKRFKPMRHEEEECEVKRLEHLIMRNLTPRQAKRVHTDMARLLHAENDDLNPDDFED